MQLTRRMENADQIKDNSHSQDTREVEPKEAGNQCETQFPRKFTETLPRALDIP